MNFIIGQLYCSVGSYNTFYSQNYSAYHSWTRPEKQFEIIE